MPFGRKQDRKIAGDHPNSFSLYFLIVCRLVFLFSSLCAVWQKTRSQNRRRPSKFIFFVFPHCVPASLFIFFTLCRLAENKIAGDHPNSFSLYFLIVCRLVFLFSSLCAVWQKTRSQNRRRPSKFIFFVFPHCVPASLFIFFTLCRLAENKIAKSQETNQIHFLCISSLCAG